MTEVRCFNDPTPVESLNFKANVTLLHINVTSIRINLFEVVLFEVHGPAGVWNQVSPSTEVKSRKGRFIHRH